MSDCLEPQNCPDELTGMPCNSCWQPDADDLVLARAATLALFAEGDR